MSTAPRFQPGRILMTPGAVDAMQVNGIKPSALVLRHLAGDWGDVDEHDKRANEKALKPSEPQRILSSYTLSEEDTVWVITEHDRSATTLLTPSDY